MTKTEQLAALLPPETDGALIVSPHNRRYFTGFPSSAGTLLVTRDAAWLLVDFRYIQAAKQKATGVSPLEYNKRGETLRLLMKQHNLRRVAVEDEGLSRGEFGRLEKELEGIALVGGVLDELISRLRLTKTPEELQKIRQAQELTDYGFSYILPHIRPGRTERELALELEFALRREGAEAAAFDFIVVSGAHSALPHGTPTDKPVEHGDFVTMDFGAVVDGWHSDMTRTVAVGECSEEQRQVYAVVRTAQEAALSVLRAGLSCRDGDAAARDVIAAAGYADYFGHGTGHGVGMEIHEAPRLSPLAGEKSLQAGSVVTVEPGVYLPGCFGVRIEDMVNITKEGCENLTKSPKELLVL